MDAARDQFEPRLGVRSRGRRVAHPDPDHADECLTGLPDVPLRVRQPSRSVQRGQQERRTVHVAGHRSGGPELLAIGQRDLGDRVGLEAPARQWVERWQAGGVVSADRVPHLEPVRGPRERCIPVLMLDHRAEPGVGGLRWDEQLVDDADLRGCVRPIVDTELRGSLLGPKRRVAFIRDVPRRPDRPRVEVVVDRGQVVGVEAGDGARTGLQRLPSKVLRSRAAGE